MECTQPEDLLDVSVGTHDVLDLLRVGVMEREQARPHDDPLVWFDTEAEHDWQNLTSVFHHLGNISVVYIIPYQRDNATKVKTY